MDTRSSRQLVLMLAILFVGSCAGAHTPAQDTRPGRDVFGTWEPLSHSVERFGTLQIAEASIRWEHGRCFYYKNLERKADELLIDTGCSLFEDASVPLRYVRLRRGGPEGPWRATLEVWWFSNLDNVHKNITPYEAEVYGIYVQR
jgi:hypothetical protein